MISSGVSVPYSDEYRELRSNPAALEKGLAHLEKHLETAAFFGLPVVVAINGAPVRSGTQLRNTIGLSRIGDQIDLTVNRVRK